MKKWLVFLVLVFLLGIGFFLYLRQRISQQNTADKLIFNADAQRWEKYTYEDQVEGDRESILATSNNEEGLHNPAVFKGYFDNYDENNQTLTIKAIVPFTQNNLVEKLEVKLLAGQSIYCAPSIYVDPNTGVAYETKSFVLPVKDGETLSFHVEKLISFTDFLEQSTEQTFLHLQLTENYDQSKTNYVQKILVIGLCE